MGFTVNGVRCGIWDYGGGRWSIYDPKDVLPSLFEDISESSFAPFQTTSPEGLMNAEPSFAVRIADDTKTQAEVNKINKQRLFDALVATTIIRIEVDFDGVGDSGQIEDIRAFDQNGERDLPDLRVSYRARGYSKPDSDDEEPLRGAIERLCYGYLEQEHAGWENNDGACGEFQIDVATKTVSLTHNERFISTETYEYEF